MVKSRFNFRLLLAVPLLFLFLAGGCAPDRDFNRQLGEITAPYRFDLTRWEFKAIWGELGKLFGSRSASTDNATEGIAEYFNNVTRIEQLKAEINDVAAGESEGDFATIKSELDRLIKRNKELAGTVEKQLEAQIREAFSRQGIYNPADRFVSIKIGFPPLNFHLGQPPHLLVISPRDRIESIREVSLLPEMAIEEMENIEDQVDALGVSSLVVGLGGLATYPSYVTDRAGLRFVLNTAGEEWLHLYLLFTPLGFLYMLDLTGIRPDYEIATMNETVASIISKEIGGIIYQEYYDRKEKDEAAQEAAPAGFDFNREMREIRRAVDDYLARGEVDQAEKFMELKRQYLATKGYHIRKLNQAYFAFHGTYADSPTSISPIGDELKELRSRSSSLKDFLDTVAVMTSRQDLEESVPQGSPLP